MDDQLAQDQVKTPKVVWIVWLQGWEKAPDLVKACRRSWEYHNSDWQVRALARVDLHHLIDTRQLPMQSLAAYSDCVRVELLYRYGGVWADATTFCTRPLDSWLPRELPGGFFAFVKPTPTRPISSWFLASQPGGAIISELHASVREYWQGRDVADQYFWLHRLFHRIVTSPGRAQQLWRQTLHIRAAPSLYLAPYGRRLLGDMSCRMSSRLALDPTSMYKLNHRADSAHATSRSAYTYFKQDAQSVLQASHIALFVDGILDFPRRWRISTRALLVYARDWLKTAARRINHRRRH